MKSTHSRAVAVMFLVTFMWSTAGVMKRQLEAARSFEVTFWRSFFTLIALLVILPCFKSRTVFAKIRHAGKVLWLSGVCWSVMFTAFMVALTLTTVANVLVMMALGPFMTAFMAGLFRLPHSCAYLERDSTGERRHCLDVLRADGLGKPAGWHTGGPIGTHSECL